MCHWIISCSCFVKGLEPPVLTLPCTCCSTAGGLNYKPCPAGKRAAHQKEQRQNYKYFGWATHNMFSKTQIGETISEKLNGIFSLHLEMSLYLQSIISIKGVPSPLTFSSKSTLRTHAKDSSYKQCPPLRSVKMNLWQPSLHPNQMLKNVGHYSGFYGTEVLTQIKKRLFYLSPYDSNPFFRTQRGIKVMHTVMNRGRITNLPFNYYSTLPNTLPVYNWTDLMILQLGQEIPS